MSNQTNAETHNTHNRIKSMLSAGFEPTIPASEVALIPRLRPRGYWQRSSPILTTINRVWTQLRLFNSHVACMVNCNYFWNKSGVLTGRGLCFERLCKGTNLNRVWQRRQNEIMRFSRIRNASLRVLTAINKSGNGLPTNSLHKSGIVTNVKTVLTVLEHRDITVPLVPLVAITLTAI